jgi:hypothetical protein
VQLLVNIKRQTLIMYWQQIKIDKVIIYAI